MFCKVNVLDIEAKCHRNDKIHKVGAKSLSVCTLTKRFVSLVLKLLSVSYAVCPKSYMVLINNGYKTQNFLIECKLFYYERIENVGLNF